MSCNLYIIRLHLCQDETTKMGMFYAWYRTSSLDAVLCNEAFSLYREKARRYILSDQQRRKPGYTKEPSRI
jgi:hypothetical protein